MRLSIVILNYNSERFCEKCLGALKRYPAKCQSEIIVVDNHSDTNRIEQICQKFPHVKLIKSQDNLGYGQGNNLGVHAASGKYLAILNPDVEVQQGTLDKLVNFLDKHHQAALVGPKLIFKNGQVQDSFRKFPRISDLLIKRLPFLRKRYQKRMQNFLMWDIDLQKPSAVDWVVGAFFVVRRKAWDEVGGFDARYFLFFEDTDLCRALWQKDWKVYFNPLVEAIHNHQRLSETNGFSDFLRKKNVWRHIVSAFKYYWKWGI